MRNALHRSPRPDISPPVEKLSARDFRPGRRGAAQVLLPYAQRRLAFPLHQPGSMGGGGFFAMDSLSGVFAVVVDPDKERRSLVMGVLRYCGALASPAETPAAALAIMQLMKPDVLIVDFSRPDDGGLELIDSVRALKPDDGGMVAVIAVGDGGTNADFARGRGFNAYLAKPIDPWEMCRIVSSLVTD